MARIYLIGFMGSGKSTLGAGLAKRLQYPFVDMDTMIERMAGKSIPEIFESKGEGYFRKLEQEVLFQTILMQDAVIACGGGTPCFYENMEWMKANGLTVFLDIAEEKLIERSGIEKHNRPLLKNKTDEELTAWISITLKNRRPFYEQSAIIFSEDEVGKLTDKVRNYL